ncbi:MAG: Uma2 family endonuclease [Acidobacteriaceae bacterium]|nr:Uma2 family endonuclease [Acidobacteriaceae bacterium]MBV9780150.1 Uma2 family endonuclease [Acidobacteriaceae bacterium]
MAVGTQISVEEYLHTVYRPDCDYVDGVVEERNLGEWDHSTVQTQLAVFFSRFRNIGLLARTELRMRIREGKYRVPDLVVTSGAPSEQVLTKPPLLCIEVLSRDDTLSRMNQRVQEYLAFGVPVVWVVDPAEKTVWIYRQNGMQEATGEAIKLDGTDIEVPFSEIFD